MVFLLSRIKRAVLHRLNPQTALRCVLQRHRKVVRFTGIANIRDRTAYYVSIRHFLHDVPAIIPRRKHHYLVAQNFMHGDFLSETRPKVYFSREPDEFLSEETRLNLAKVPEDPHVLSFADEDPGRRMFYVALPERRKKIIALLESSLDQDRPGLCCIVNRYKTHDRLELLQQRFRYIRAMDQDIDIYGHAPSHGKNPWDDFPNYRGATRNKIRTLRAYRFNLCFENCDRDGYITEKLLQALIAGCVPLYWGGGRFTADTVPPSCYINCRNRNPLEIHQRIRAMSLDEIVYFRRAGLDFLSSTGADRFTWKYWAERVAERLEAQ